MKDFSAGLLAWYDKNRRELPWRQDVTPYRVWVSEIMLQQTRIEAARGYFQRFMEAFPTVEALAAADGETVLKLWEGLGYYSRARNLHACARRVTEEYGGRFPDRAEDLRRLPGIGEYTAGAIASIAFGRPEPAVDGNVLRVLARYTRCGKSVGETGVKARFREELRAIYPAGRCGDFTSALMELGETVCTPGTPACPACPLREDCLAHRAGEETAYPVLPPKKPRRVERRQVLLLIRGDRVALRKRPEKGLLGGMWEYPNRLEGEPPPGGTCCGSAVHIFSHVEWHMTGYILRPGPEAPDCIWVTPEERRALAIPAAFRHYSRVLEEMGL